MIPDLLIARVEQGVEPDQSLAQLLCYEFESDPAYATISTLIFRALVDDSLDAVIAFVALKIPTWRPSLVWIANGVDASLLPPMGYQGEKISSFSTKKSRALLAVTLMALNRSLTNSEPLNAPVRKFEQEEIDERIKRSMLAYDHGGAVARKPAEKPERTYKRANRIIELAALLGELDPIHDGSRIRHVRAEARALAKDLGDEDRGEVRKNDRARRLVDRFERDAADQSRDKSRDRSSGISI